MLEANTDARAFYAACGGDDVEVLPWTGPDGTSITSHRIVWRDPGSITAT